MEMTENRKYYRNLVQIEILSDRQWGEVTDLEEIAYQIRDGDSSGSVSHPVIDEEVTPERMSELLIAQGSEPSFLIPQDDGGWDEYLHGKKET